MGKSKEQVSDDKGQTEKTQVPESNGETDSQTGVHVVDATIKYNLNPRRGDIVDGDELIARANRGTMLDKTQSDLHKAQEEMKRLQTERDDMENQIALLSRISKIEESESRSSKAEEVEEDVFSYTEEATKPVVNTKLIRQEIDPEFKKIDEKMSAVEKELQTLKDERAERERKEAARDFGEGMRKARRVELKTELSVLSDQEIDEIISSEDAYQRREMQAMGAAYEGNAKTFEEAQELMLDAKVYRNKAVKLLTTAQLKQERAEAKRQAEAQLLGRSTTGDGDKEVAETMKRVTNPLNEEKVRAKRIEIAKEKEKARGALRRNLG